MNSQFLDPVFLGRYPARMKDIYGDAWPAFPAEDFELIAQPLDFIGVNYYTRSVTRDDALGTIQPWLRSHDIYSRGRFGAWLYEIGNMDHSGMMGVEFVDHVLTGAPETVPASHIRRALTRYDALAIETEHHTSLLKRVGARLFYAAGRSW